MKDKIIKGYKAFEKGLICKGQKYEIGKKYTHKGKVELCKSGFHFCLNPLDTLNYYDLNESEFAKVSANGVAKQTDGEDTKRVAKYLEVDKKLGLSDFVNESISYLVDECNKGKSKKVDGDHAQVASSGDYAKVASSGNFAQVASSSDYAQVASSGNYAQVASSGDYAKVASSSDYAQVASSGNSAQVASSGNSAQVASSGDYARVASSGNYAQVASSGNYAKVASSSDYAQVASSGNSAQVASSDDYARVASSGNYAQVAIKGKDSVGANIGIDGVIKGVKGSWITLAEYDDNYKPVCVKSVKVDGKKIKADTWYGLKNKKFIETKVEE